MRKVCAVLVGVLMSLGVWGEASAEASYTAEVVRHVAPHSSRTVAIYCPRYASWLEYAWIVVSPGDIDGYVREREVSRRGRDGQRAVFVNDSGARMEGTVGVSCTKKSASGT